MAVIWCFPAMKMNLRLWLSCKEMVFVCVIWSFDDMGLGEQVILSDNKIEEISMLYKVGDNMVTYIFINHLDHIRKVIANSE